MKLKINNKSEFIQKFLIPISRINDLCTLKIDSNSISTLSRTPDSNFVLYSLYKDVEIIDYTAERSISFADIKKFIKAFECTEGDVVELILNENNIEYKSSNIKFKFHLINDNIIKTPNFNLDKIEALVYDVESTIPISVILSLIKSSTFITDSNKIYIKSNGTSLVGELSDKTKDNIDSFTTKLSDIYVGPNIETPVVLNFDIFRIISALKMQEINIRLNTQRGFVAFDLSEDKYKIKYIATAMVS